MFAGFALDDFDQYAPDRAGSNVYNRQRLLIKEKLVAVGRAAAEALGALGAGMQMATTDHAPSLRNAKRVERQAAYFARAGEQRALVEEVLEGSRGAANLLVEPAPHVRHAAIDIAIDANGIFVGARVCAKALVDAANLRALLAAAEGRGEFRRALAALPDAHVFAAPGVDPIPAAAVRDGDIDAFLAAFEEASDASIEIGRRFGRAEAAAVGSGFPALGRECAAALFPIHRLLAWSPSNDHIEFDALIERVRAERAHEESEHDREEQAFLDRKAQSLATARERMERALAEWDTSKTRAGTREVVWPVRMQVPRAAKQLPRAAPEAGEKMRQPSAAAPGDDRAAAGDAPVAARETPARRTDAPATGKPGAAPAAKPRTAARPAAATRAGAAPDRAPAAGTAAPQGCRWSRGDLVRILHGSLRGRVGTFWEADAHGHTRVMLGLLTVRLMLDDIAEPRRKAVGS